MTKVNHLGEEMTVTANTDGYSYSLILVSAKRAHFGDRIVMMRNDALMDEKDYLWGRFLKGYSCFHDFNSASKFMSEEVVTMWTRFHDVHVFTDVEGCTMYFLDGKELTDDEVNIYSDIREQKLLV